jgi:Na+(H+)/acetate symporter ActP
MNNWITALLNTGRRQNILKMFGRKKNNRGMMWATLLGLGVSATALGLGRNRNRNMLRPVQNVMNNIRTRTAGQMPNAAAITEFSKELAPNKNSLNDK